jgi:hypothetical protein
VFLAVPIVMRILLALSFSLFFASTAASANAAKLTRESLVRLGYAPVRTSTIIRGIHGAGGNPIIDTQKVSQFRRGKLSRWVSPEGEVLAPVQLGKQQLFVRGANRKPILVDLVDHEWSLGGLPHLSGSITLPLGGRIRVALAKEAPLLVEPGAADARKLASDDVYRITELTDEGFDVRHNIGTVRLTAAGTISELSIKVGGYVMEAAP